MKLRFQRFAALAVGAGVVIGGMLLGGPASPASADPVSAPVCGAGEATGTALQGTYGNLTVHGVAYVADGASVTVRGNLTVAADSCLDAFSMGTVHVQGNVLVQPGAVLGLGCAPFVNGEPMPCTGATDDTIGGNLVANQPLTMYLTALHVNGNLVSQGGGQHSNASFPIKDSWIGGNLIVNGWQGGAFGWFGILRNTVQGNVVITDNTGSRPGASGPDSNEVDGNTVGGNLICQNNTPTARYGDAPEPLTNTVGGRAIGECAALTH